MRLNCFVSICGLAIVSLLCVGSTIDAGLVDTPISQLLPEQLSSLHNLFNNHLGRITNHSESPEPAHKIKFHLSLDENVKFLGLIALLKKQAQNEPNNLLVKQVLSFMSRHLEVKMVGTPEEISQVLQSTGLAKDLHQLTSTARPAVQDAMSESQSEEQEESLPPPTVEHKHLGDHERRFGNDDQHKPYSYMYKPNQESAQQVGPEEEQETEQNLEQEQAPETEQLRHPRFIFISPKLIMSNYPIHGQGGAPLNDQSKNYEERANEQEQDQPQEEETEPEQSAKTSHQELCDKLRQALNQLRINALMASLNARQNPHEEQDSENQKI